jgi:hypothetical protein
MFAVLVALGINKDRPRIIQLEEENLGIIELDYTAALTGDEARPCHIVVYQPKGDTFKTPLPQRLVVYDYPENQDGEIFWQCYRDDMFLEYADLLQYDRVTKIEFADIDGDNIDEAIISWDSDCMGSGWIQTLEVLDYDLETEEFRSYKGVTASGPFGGFLINSLDPDGSVQRVFAYSFRSDGMDTYTGTECRWCPHRYRVAVYTITEDGLVIDPRWNDGEIAYTQLRFPCDGSGNPTDEYRSLNEYYMCSSLYNALDAGPPFVVLSPQPDQTVSLPFSLRVEMPQDMPKLGIQIVSVSPNGNEKILLDDIIEGWAYEPGTSLKVEDSVYYAAPSGTSGRIVLYDPANPDDADRILTIPVIFEQVETKIVQVYFPNSQTESNDLVFPVERTIPVTEGVMDQLARGPTGQEEAIGYFTYLLPTCKAQNFYYVEYPCSATKLWDIRIEDGVARFTPHDFDTLETIRQPGRAGKIAREQIRQTLLQFPDVMSVTFWAPDGSLIAE